MTWKFGKSIDFLVKDEIYHKIELPLKFWIHLIYRDIWSLKKCEKKKSIQRRYKKKVARSKGLKNPQKVV